MGVVVSVVFGRDGELEAIERLLEALDAGPAALVFEGEPGSGKTTLVRAGIDTAEGRGAAVLGTAPGASDAGLSYAALADLCRTVGPDAIGRLPAPQRHALEVALLRRAPGAVAIDHRTVATAALSLLEDLAAEAPIVVAIDDWQWLDPSSARVVGFCARRVAGRVGFIVSRRPGEDPAETVLSLREPDRVESLRLGPLPAAALGRMLSERVPPPLGRRDLARVEQASGGNPFYALELARALHANGALLPLSPSLDAVVADRIDGVGRDVEDVLLSIAILAAPTVGALGELYGPYVEERLEEAERAGLIVLAGERVRFTHPLLASGVYARTPALRRRAMHRRASAAVTEPEERARHLAHAGSPEALPALDHAAREVRARGAPDAAAELLELALERGGGPGLRVRAAEHHLDVGELGRARELLEAAIAALPAGTARAHALMLLAEIRYTDESVPAGRALLEQARSEAAGDERLRLMVELRLVYLLCTSGLVPEGDAMAGSALVLAERVGERALLAQALAVRVVVDVWIGRELDERRLRRALELEDFGPHTPAELFPSWIAAKLLLATGRVDEARATLDRARAALVERGAASAAAWAHTLTAFIECWRGDLAAAAAAAAELAAEADALATAHGRAMALSGRARVDALAGRVEEARRECDEALTALDRGGWFSWSATVRIARGWLELSLGDHEAAAAHLEPLAGLAFATQLPDPPAVPFVADTVEAFVGVGRPEEAETLVALLERRGAALGRDLDLALSARARGLLHAANGDVEAAERAFERALTAHEHLPMPIERARTLLHLGAIRRRVRKRRAAKAALDEALAIFESVGAPLWAARATAEIDCLGLRPRATDRLTPSEQRVATLAASGLTNREVAATLVVSDKTVEAHLARAYRKLGIRSRAQLGACMARLQAAGPDRRPGPIGDLTVADAGSRAPS
jgi:DNA-binding NarL/FixJ family response regulator